MDVLEAVCISVLGCFLFQITRVNQHRARNKKWPWHDRKTNMTLSFFIFGMLVKLITAAGLAGMLAYTGQISGAWGAFIMGMIAEPTVSKLGDSALKEITK